MQTPINICFAALQPHRFLDQLALARGIKALAGERFEIFFFVADAVFHRYSNILSDFDFIIINDVSHFSAPILKPSFIDKAKANIRSVLPIRIKHALKYYLQLFKTTRFFDSCLKQREYDLLKFLETNFRNISELLIKRNIHVLFVNGDRHLGFEPVFLKISQTIHIPSIIPYLVHFADEETLCVDKFKEVEYQASAKWLSSNYIRGAADIQYKAKGKYYFYPHPVANALSKFGVLSDNPYFMGCGKSDIICLNNRHHAEHYTSNGVNSRKIRITGDATYDLLFKQHAQRDHLRTILVHKYGFVDTQKVIIVSLPQLAEHGILSWDAHWHEIEFLLDSLSKLDQNILVSLHPKMDTNKYRYLETKYRCRIADERLAEILPTGDLFVATFSSTVTWAILCGISTVIVDFYGFNFTIYDFLTSITKVNNKQLLQAALRKAIVTQPDFSSDWASLSRNEVFDGNTMQRYVDLVLEVSGNQ